MKKIFVIEGASGCYEDYRTWPICAYSSKEEAEARISILKAKQAKLEARRYKLQKAMDDAEDNDPAWDKAYEEMDKFTDKYGYDAGDESYRIKTIPLYESKADASQQEARGE